MADGTYTQLADELHAQWLAAFTYSEAHIARLRELNSPRILIESAMTPHLNSQHEIIIHWLRQLDGAGPIEAKKIRRQLRANGFSLSAKAIIKEAE